MVSWNASPCLPPSPSQGNAGAKNPNPEELKPLSKHSWPRLRPPQELRSRHSDPQMKTQRSSNCVEEPAFVCVESMAKKIIQQQKRGELEQEISTLQEMLTHEEKVHDILEQIYKGHGNSGIRIPNYIPPEMKEALQELSVVEEEIAQLEDQIKKLQGDLKQEQDATKKSKSYQWRHGVSGIPRSPRGCSSLPPIPYPKESHERVEYETKALHFISKAIKGDHNLNNFSLNEKAGKFSRSLPDYRKENHFPEAEFPEVSRKSGAVKPASPLRASIHTTPKRERSAELPLSDLTPASQSNLISPEELNQKWQPNKLSESIVRCLIFIFVRLTRTSRTMELEKAGSITRPTNPSSSPMSFRVDMGTNSKASIMLQRESKQQDPYGIFESEESIPRDIGPYKNLLIFTSSSLDPKCISNSSSITLLEKLRGLMNCLQKVDLRSLTPQQKLAFWINMYNACIMHGFLQYGVPSSPQKSMAFMNKATLNIGGKVINAQAIEHFILKKPGSSIPRERSKGDDKEAMIREFHGFESSDINVPFALCGGTRSSPAVRIYTAEGVVAELERSKVEYLQASIMVSHARKMAFPELLLRNVPGFSGDPESLVKWICDQLPTAGTLRKSMVDCFRSHGGDGLSSVVERIPYDFEFQYLLPV